MIVCGIDPGVTGALAFIGPGGRCALEDLPTIEVPGAGRTNRKLCGRGLADLLRKHVPPDEVCMVVIEDVHTMPGNKSGASANTSLMHSKGVIEGVLGVLRVEIRLVNSQRWKRFYGLGKDKKESLVKARVLFPAIQGKLTRVMDNNRAEALLIANYGLRNLT